MRKTRSDRAEEQASLPLTPMIDVTFLLLIFFLCTLRFRALEGKLTAALPRDAGSVQRTLREEIGIRVRVVDPGEPVDLRRSTPSARRGRVIAYRVAGTEYRSVAALELLLVELYRSDPSLAVRIDAGAGTLVGEIVAVLDAAQIAGFGQIGFASGR